MVGLTVDIDKFKELVANVRLVGDETIARELSNSDEPSKVLSGRIHWVLHGWMSSLGLSKEVTNAILNEAE